MPEFSLTISTDSDAFYDGADGAFELARILHQLADRLEAVGFLASWRLRDSNGNTVGSWTIT